MNDRQEIRPSSRDRCAECGGARLAASGITSGRIPRIRRTCSGTLAGSFSAAEPPPIRHKRLIRDFDPNTDLGVFFHSWCAPRAKLPEKLQEEFAEVLAKCLVADLEKTILRWAKVWHSLPHGVDPLRCRAHVANAEGWRLFVMTRSEWERLRGVEGKVIEIELARLPGGGVQESSAGIARLAGECSVERARIEVWPYKANERPRIDHIHRYVVFENLGRRVNLPKFAERVSTSDTLCFESISAITYSS
jgi:hypothetical protein